MELEVDSHPTCCSRWPGWAYLLAVRAEKRWSERLRRAVPRDAADQGSLRAPGAVSNPTSRLWPHVTGNPRLLTSSIYDLAETLWAATCPLIYSAGCFGLLQPCYQAAIVIIEYLVEVYSDCTTPRSAAYLTATT